jgi:hypothetical protein
MHKRDVVQIRSYKRIVHAHIGEPRHFEVDLVTSTALYASSRPDQFDVDSRF